MTRLIRLLPCLTLVGLLGFAGVACGGDGDPASLDEDAAEDIERRNAEVRRTDEMREDARQALLDMEVAQCQQKDHYQELLVEYSADFERRERQLADGSTFYFDCGTGDEDWRFPGEAADVWHRRTAVVTHEVAPELDALFSLDIVSPPMDRRHVAYGDDGALTLGELSVGQLVCAHLAYPPGWESLPDVTQYRVTALASALTPIGGSPNKYSPYPVLAAVNTERHPAGGPSEMLMVEHIGLTPFRDTGLWSRNYVTDGLCPAG